MQNIQFAAIHNTIQKENISFQRMIIQIFKLFTYFNDISTCISSINFLNDLLTTIYQNPIFQLCTINL